tara:strand:- start:776 stop:1054 length:279 start_codon:yes stop_codon:yes gene_type:complete
MADNDEKEMRNGSAPGTTVTGNQLLVAVIFLPVVIVWLFLAARIIWSATSNPETLQSIEGLLTALAVLTIPVSMGLNEMFKAFSNESAKKDE